MPAGMIHPYVVSGIYASCALLEWLIIHYMSACSFIYKYIMFIPFYMMILLGFITLCSEYGVLKRHLVFIFYSDDISLDGLEQELEECKNDDVSYSIINSFGYMLINDSLSCNPFFIVFLYAFSLYFIIMFYYVNWFLLFTRKMGSYVFFRGLCINDPSPPVFSIM